MIDLSARFKKLEIGKQDNLPIGSVIQAFLTEKQFQQQSGEDWVLCDGRDVKGSKYQALGYGSTIPDCRGLFLRTTGGQAAPLKGKQDQATAVNGLIAKLTEAEIEDSSIRIWEDHWRPNPPGFRIRHPSGGAYATYFAGGTKRKQHTHELELTGDTETRPDNISINTFMRIN